ncbi:CheR family methyltransferase [Clostridium thailandense]|uniref:Protein-glutamate O-methyltransferase CheR n=1 Tax=Clostridium thailandense TaxID=2794346 RepID=A0A949X2R3_9CLOT|nr:protein-glutamate O-methyltransferase CheR [Clostridium thailandense]MBV7273574.1 protein-glutamate O-methyltransferase CheR [Clostridium thailandense]
MMQIKEKEFKYLVQYMKSNYGINLINKKILIEGRLGNYISEKGFSSFDEYINYAVNDSSGREITTLVNKLTTNHTFFMREADHFNYLKNKALPSIIASIKDRDLRVWSAGCSTGEEPYTLAMIISEFLGDCKKIWDTKILATDISVNALEKAKEGIYSLEAIENLPTSWKYNNFNRIDSKSYRVSDKIRNEIIYRVFNLMEPVFPFKKKFHIIFCRNVMIYFDEKTKKELIEKFYQFTEPGGYLFIGHSEFINKNDTGYKYIMPAVYQKG